jgi:CPA2 family monovalent cation:H+ antiporter-2
MSAAPEPSSIPNFLKIIACAVPFALVFLRLGQSPIVGYLFAGLVMGPGGLDLIPQDAIGEIAEVGVGLLLFTIGIELSLSRVFDLRRIAFGGGALQVLGTMAATAVAVALATGRPLEAVFVGCAVALSSSAIILKTLADKGELDAPYTGPATAVAIFQDLATVPMLVVLPALGAQAEAATGGGLALRIVEAVLKAAGLLVVLYLGSRYAIDRLLYFVARAKSPEVFVLAAAALILAAAWGAHMAGLPLALGAFLAGILLADSDYASQILAEVNPVKGLFQATFFVSIGMLLDPRVVLERPATIAAVVAAIILGKAAIATGALVAVGASPRVAAAAAIILSQVGEFSFVVVSLGKASGLLSDAVYQLTLAASFASMAVAPPLIANVRAIVDLLARTPRVGRRLAAPAGAELAATAKELDCHVVIGGFGPVGREVATFLLDHGRPFVAVELNPKTVKELAGAGIPIFYGDFSNPTVLEEAGIERAHAFVVAAPDIAATRRAVRIARGLNPKLLIVARTKYRATVPAIRKDGADEVVEEEFETAIEMVARLTRVLGLSRATVAEHIEGQRLERYALSPAPGPREEGNVRLDESQSIKAVKVAAERAHHHPPAAPASPPGAPGPEGGGAAG